MENSDIHLCQETLKGHSNSVDAMTYDQESKTLFSGSQDESVKVWTPDDSGEYHASSTQTLTGQSGCMRALAYDQDTKTLFSADINGTINVWSTMK